MRIDRWDQKHCLEQILSVRVARQVAQITR